MRLIIPLLVLTCVLLASCANVPMLPPMDIDSFVFSESIPLEQNTDKVLYHSPSGMLAALSIKTQEIHIYQGQQRKNILGGLGYRFLLLSDIALGSDGHIMALDSAARSVFKYGQDGNLLGSFDLKGVMQPTLLTLQGEQNMFIYDSATAEIVAYSMLDGTEMYRFGRFQLQQVSSLSCNRDYLVAYSKNSNSSVVFSLLGQFLKNVDGHLVYDVYNNAIALSGGMLKNLASAAYLPLSTEIETMAIDRDFLVLGIGREARLIKINYLRIR